MYLHFERARVRHNMADLCTHAFHQGVIVNVLTTVTHLISRAARPLHKVAASLIDLLDHGSPEVHNLISCQRSPSRPSLRINQHHQTGTNARSKQKHTAIPQAR
jgi:hypothetical protein